MSSYLIENLSDKDFESYKQAIWFYNFLLARGWIQQQLGGVNSISFQQLKEELLRNIYNIKSKTLLAGSGRNAPRDFFNKVNSIFESSQLDASECEFIRVIDPRSRYAIWCYISNFIDKEHSAKREDYPGNPSSEIERSKFFNYLPDGPICKHYALKNDPLTDKEFSESIISFLNVWEVPKVIKLECINKFREIIQWAGNFKSAFKWLDKSNDAQCLWAADYMKSRNIFLNHSLRIQKTGPTKQLLPLSTACHQIMTQSYYF